MAIDKATLDEIALSEKEYEMIVERLGREPRPVELGMFGALWSEHCGYKHSKPLLKLFPSYSKRVLIQPGEENAGAVDIGSGLAIVMKIESHNHPSAIEPYQGAATGVGGIVRDIFTMGAFPIALLNSLRFGPLTEPRNRYLFSGVVGGIAGYGNCLGIPNVGGEVVFSPSYTHNPLVNAMCVGLVEKKRLVRAIARGEGSVMLLVGADTGRDGIHGASGLASRTFEEDRELRSTVQVGNPFLEKLLIEACIEASRSPHVLAIQDLGAAGLTSAAVESAGRADMGIEVDVGLVPRREKGMTPYEVMLSESQERMLIIARQGSEDEVKAIFQRWDLHCEVIGRVTSDGVARIREDGQAVAEVPIELLVDPPQYRLKGVPPPWQQQVQHLQIDQLPLPSSPSAVLLDLLASPNIASKLPVYRQYDHQVQNDTVIPPGGDAAVLRVKGTRKGIALATDGNGKYCYLDPYQGGAIAVAEAARNVASVGAEPIAVTNGLNMGNPERAEVYWQMEQVIKGMAAACRALDISVISGNVSLYNETRGEPIYPTPIIGMLGLLPNLNKRCTHAFKDAGDLVFLLGGDSNSTNLGGSEYLERVHGKVQGRPSIDMRLERRVQRCLLACIRAGLIKSSHDCSDGGLAVALAECAIAGGIGFRGSLAGKERWDAVLFGEGQSRIVISVSPENRHKLEELARRRKVPLSSLGVVGGRQFAIQKLINLPLAQVKEAWEGGLDRALA